MSDDPVIPGEVDAWIDGELDLERAHMVESRLAADPAAAARAMAALRDRTALRIVAQAGAAPPPGIEGAAARLGARLATPARRARMPWAGGFAGGIAAALALAIGLPELSARNDPPAYVGEAVAAYRTGLIRARMASQVETPVADAREIAGNTALRVPRMPEGWRVTDVQLVPSDDGPALQIMARMPDERVVSVFAMRADEDEADLPSSPETVAQGDTSAAFWMQGDMAYAVIGTDSPDILDPLAERVAAEQAS